MTEVVLIEANGRDGIADESAVAQREDQPLLQVPRVQVQKRLQSRERCRPQAADAPVPRRRLFDAGLRQPAARQRSAPSTAACAASSRLRPTRRPSRRRRRATGLPLGGTRPSPAPETGRTPASRARSAPPRQTPPACPSRNRQAAGWTTSVAPNTPSTFMSRPRGAAPVRRHRRVARRTRASSSPSATLRRSSASRSRLADEIEGLELGTIAPERRLVRTGTSGMKEDFDGTGGSRTTQVIERGAHVREGHRPRSKHPDEDLGARHRVTR